MSWRRKLTFPLKMRSGATLRTLQDAILVLVDRTEAGPCSDPARIAKALLEQAARTQLPEDVRAATNQMRHYLHGRGELAPTWAFWRRWRI